MGAVLVKNRENEPKTVSPKKGGLCEEDIIRSGLKTSEPQSYARICIHDRDHKDANSALRLCQGQDRGSPETIQEMKSSKAECSETNQNCFNSD